MLSLHRNKRTSLNPNAVLWYPSFAHKHRTVAELPFGSLSQLPCPSPRSSYFRFSCLPHPSPEPIVPSMGDPGTPRAVPTGTEGRHRRKWWAMWPRRFTSFPASISWTRIWWICATCYRMYDRSTVLRSCTITNRYRMNSIIRWRVSWVGIIVKLNKVYVLKKNWCLLGFIYFPLMTISPKPCFWGQKPCFIVITKDDSNNSVLMYLRWFKDIRTTHICIGFRFFITTCALS